MGILYFNGTIVYMLMLCVVLYVCPRIFVKGTIFVLKNARINKKIEFEFEFESLSLLILLTDATIRAHQC